MVSKRSSTRKKGRPPGDPLDVRQARFSFRLHPDLYDEINKAARRQGLNHSLWIERACVEKVHRETKDATLLDVIGRYSDPHQCEEAADRRAAELSKPKKR